MFNLSDYKMRVTDTQVLFWGGPPSQWFKSGFEGYLPEIVEKDGRRSLRKAAAPRKFSSAEKYMMMAKASIFNDAVQLELMAKSHDVKALKAHGRDVLGFNQEIWDSVCIPIVTIGTYYKAVQSDDMWAFTNDMGEREYVEGSPHDDIWGVGLAWNDPKIEDKANWRGENKLGTCWMNCWEMIVAFGRDADPFKAYGHLVRERANG